LITFAAFHPDCVYVDGTGDDGRAPVFGPLGPYHSALALFAFRNGLSPREANALFNNNVFEALRYFDFWNEASAELIDGVKRTRGPDLSAELGGWARRGVFMYTVKPELNSKRRNGPCNALILLIWGSDFSKTWCHVCMLFRLVHG